MELFHACDVLHCARMVLKHGKLCCLSQFFLSCFTMEPCLPSPCTLTFSLSLDSFYDVGKLTMFFEWLLSRGQNRGVFASKTCFRGLDYAFVANNGDPAMGS